MKKRTCRSIITGLALALAATIPLHSARAGSFYSDFNSGLPTNAAIFGNTIISANGGYTNSGCLELTIATNSQNGGFVITNDLDNGIPVVGFTAAFKVLIGGGTGTPGDGISFNFGSDVPFSTITEEGAGSGLTVEYDTFDNSPTPPDNVGIDVKVGGVEIATTVTTTAFLTPNTFVDSLIQLNPDGSLDVEYNGVWIYTNLPTGLGPITGGLFGLGARTGGDYDNQFIDNFSITTYTNANAFIAAFSPTGLKTPLNTPIDIVLTNDVTQVQTNTIVLKVDGSKVSPSITQDGLGNTDIHYAPAPWVPLSSHTVNLVFVDNASPTPNTNNWTYGFTVVDSISLGSYTTIFFEGFETYNHGSLDQNDMVNPGPNGGPGNPWWGYNPANSLVVGVAETGVTPHGGTNMISGHLPYDLDQDWYNLAYRLHGGKPYYGNCMLEWWFYDPSGPGDSNYEDDIALAYYGDSPTNTDAKAGDLYLTGAGGIQRLVIGAANNESGAYSNFVYQVRTVGASGGYNANGWFNTTVPRSIGWHHARIVAGPILTNNTTSVFFYLDDMSSPIFYNNSSSSLGFNIIEVNDGTSGTLGYFDDISFAVTTPPNPVVTRSGSSAIIAWAGQFTLQSATNVKGPYTDILSATSPYTNSAPAQFFRLRTQ